jgi:hypothetical protein
MSAQSPFTVIANALQPRALQVRMPARCGYPLWKQLFKPCALGILGLAIAVVLWGTGYKLSLYHRHPAPSPVPVAKLWIESRNASLAVASGLKTKSHFVSDSQTYLDPIQRLPQQGRAGVCILSVCTHDVAYFGFLIPFRSPPPPRFLLA